METKQDTDIRGKYVCQRCGACCRWPGNVRIDDEEITLMADFLNLSESEFIDRYTRIHTDRKSLSIIEKDNDECIFFVKGGCVVNPVKPQQCRDFPNQWNFPGWREKCRAVFIEER